MPELFRNCFVKPSSLGDGGRGWEQIWGHSVLRITIKSSLKSRAKLNGDKVVGNWLWFAQKKNEEKEDSILGGRVAETSLEEGKSYSQQVPPQGTRWPGR